MVLYPGIQDDIKMLGNYGCAFLCANYILGNDIEVLPKKISICQNNKTLDFDFTVNDWTKLFNSLQSEKQFKVEKTSTWTTDFDYCIGMYYNPETKHTHFVVLDKEKKIIFDPLKNSQTVKHGYLANYRFIRIVK